MIIYEWTLTSSSLGDVIESILRAISSQVHSKACNTLTLLLKFISSMNDDDKQLSIKYCLKGEYSIWNRIQSHSHREQIKVCTCEEEEES